MIFFNAFTSGRRLRYEKFPGFGLENVLVGPGARLVLLDCWGTGPPRFEKVRCLGVVKNLGLAALLFSDGMAREPGGCGSAGV